MRAMGVDVGGTTTRVAVVDEHARVFHQTRFATPIDRTGDKLFSRLNAAVIALEKQAATEGDVLTALGVAVPGPVDRPRQRVTRSINLPFLADRDVVHDLRSATDLPIFLTTDADAATWGEYAALASTPDIFAHLRLGTGIACGVIADGRVVDLSNGRTDHLDALVVNGAADAAVCRCGKRGCLETVASGIAICEEAMVRGYAADLAELQRGWDGRRTWAVEIVEEVASATMKAVEQIGRTYGVDSIVLGGGVIETLPGILAGISKLVDDRGGRDLESANPGVQRARLGDSAGVVGAALLAMQSNCHARSTCARENESDFVE